MINSPSAEFGEVGFRDLRPYVWACVVASIGAEALNWERSDSEEKRPCGDTTTT